MNIKIIASLKKKLAIIRYTEWWLGKISLFLTVIIYLAFITNTNLSLDLLKYISVWMTTYIGIAGFGYFINDCFDINLDKQANKPNRAAEMTKIQRVLLLFTLGLVGIYPWFLLEIDTQLATLVFLEFFLLSAYAIPPIRLKKRDYLGLIADAFYSKVIPFWLTLHAFSLYLNHSLKWYIYLISFPWLFIWGIRLIVGHHIKDAKADASAAGQVFNLANKFDSRKLVKFIQTYLIPIETFGFIVFCFTLPKGKELILTIFICYNLLYYLTQDSNSIWYQLSKGHKPLNLFAFNFFYMEWLPIIVLILWLPSSLQSLFLIILFCYCFSRNILSILFRFSINLLNKE